MRPLSSVWTPPVTGYANHYDFSDDAVLTVVSGGISSVTDKGSAGHTATQGTAANRPIRVLTPSGLYGAVFDGSNDGLTSSMDMSDMTSCFLGVCCTHKNDGNQAIVGPSADDGIEIRVDGTTLLVLHADITSIGSASAIVPGQPFVWAVNLTAAECDVFLGLMGSGIAKTDNAHAQATTAGRTGAIGHAPSVPATDRLNGWIGEIVHYTSTLTDDEVTETLRWLADKWEIQL